MPTSSSRPRPSPAVVPGAGAAAAGPGGAKYSSSRPTTDAAPHGQVATAGQALGIEAGGPVEQGGKKKKKKKGGARPRPPPGPPTPPEQATPWSASRTELLQPRPARRSGLGACLRPAPAGVSARASLDDGVAPGGRPAPPGRPGQARTGHMGDRHRGHHPVCKAGRDHPLAAGRGLCPGRPGAPAKTAVALPTVRPPLYTHRFPLERQGVLVVGPTRPSSCV